MEPPQWDYEDDEPPRKRVRQVVTKAIAVTLIIGIVLAFPLYYVIETILRRQRPEVLIAVAEAVVIAVIWVAVRTSRRR
jgi:Mg/Co/Ni transporter MgtE